MIEVFIFETETMLETLEDVLLQGERQNLLNTEQINEVFRIMHTIKGSSSMMSYDDLSHAAHAVEDLFSYIRENSAPADAWDSIFDIVLGVNDFLKAAVALISSGEDQAINHRDSESLVTKIHTFLDLLTGGGSPEPEPVSDSANASADTSVDAATTLESDAPFFKVKVIFETDCQMENLRAFGVVNSINHMCIKLAHVPEDLMVESASDEIAKNGFTMYLQSDENPDDLKRLLDGVMFLQSASVIPISTDNEDIPASIRPAPAVAEVHEEVNSASVAARPAAPASEAATKQNFISVNVNKLDKLLDLVGEIVTTESMVTKNPEVVQLHIEGFDRAGSELRKLINELQEVVMSIRMLPVSTTFHKMQRIVRDMSKKVAKDVDLVIIGEETEVDKNIIDNLSDPLMHLIRNAVDHGLESTQERLQKGKSATGTVTLEARNTGGDVMILVSDDGKGLDKSGIVRKALEKGLITKSEAEISDREAFSLIFAPGFSTNSEVTEFSGRGVGMDVVRRSIENVSGTIAIESEKDKGTTIVIRIPLTLAIIEGMKLRVGKLLFIVPMLSISESFKPNDGDVFLDPDGREQIMIRGECYPVLRLHRIFDIEPDVENLTEGILIMIRTENSSFCLFVDQLIGEQQAVVKPLPLYLQKHNNNMHGIGGCAILGDGSISLIIDINSLVE